MRLRKSYIFWISLLIALVALFGLSFGSNQSAKVFFEESGAVVQVEIADSQKEKYEGLFGREGICENCGMLFILYGEEIPEFSMRGMRFDLDFIWINEEKVVDIDRNIPIDFVGGIFPEGEVDRVLEISAGRTERLGIRVGDKVKIE